MLAEYDSAAIPDMFEVFVYETIIRTAALGAFSPRTSTSRARTCWSPRAASKRDRVGARTPLPEVKEEDVYAFVSEVLDDDDESVGLIEEG